MKRRASERDFGVDREDSGVVSGGEDGYSVINNYFTCFDDDGMAAINRIDIAIEELNRPIVVTAEEVEALLESVYLTAEQDGTEQNVLKPIFMSVIDGAMRSFSVTSTLGVTPSQILEECERFTYSNYDYNVHVSDTLTEYAFEEHQRNLVGEGRTIASRDLRDVGKMNKYKNEHFNGSDVAVDEYSPGGEVYRNNSVAFENDNTVHDGRKMHPESAEVDHIIPCKVVCDDLRKNKALNNEDIKDIINCDGNLAVTSRDINNKKRADTNADFVKKNRSNLSEDEGAVLVEKAEQAEKAIGEMQNDVVFDNIKHDARIQKVFVQDASKAALGQVGGALIVYIIKPIYFEMKDSFRNGLEDGVCASDFKEALKLRLRRVKKYIMDSLPGQLTMSAFQFLQSFVSMLIEAIIGCLTGLFKMIWRIVKEGFKIIIGAMSVLSDVTKTLAEKGDAILELAGVSVSVVAGVYIDSAMKNFGIPEPWSILFASVSSAVVASGILCVLNKLDVFHVKKEVRRRRIIEILEAIDEEVSLEAKEQASLSEYSYTSNLLIA